MVTKKQLAALAYGRAVRQAKITKAKYEKKTTKKTCKKKTTKKKSKAEYNEPTKIIYYNGEPLEIPISKIPKGSQKWKKIGKGALNAAIAAGTIGALGYGGYKGKQFYDEWLAEPVEWGWEALKDTYQGAMAVKNTIGAARKAWKDGDKLTDKLGNVGGLLKDKTMDLVNGIWDKVTKKGKKAENDTTAKK